jgi:hypothetical protein
MLLLKPRSLLFHFLAEQLDSKYDQTKNKNQQADTIYPVHVTDPFAFRAARIFFLYVEIFGDLTPDAHD